MIIKLNGAKIEVTHQANRVDTERARDFIKVFTRALTQRLAHGGLNAVYTTGAR